MQANVLAKSSTYLTKIPHYLRTVDGGPMIRNASFNQLSSAHL